jgi:uncharacterized protein
MSEKIIRDPVHDVIAFRTDRPMDALLFRLVNAAEVQRLRRIRQLGMASLAYPGADHSRYSHSLGVMETARKMLNRLREFFRVDAEMECVCLTGALLHDLGHGPFSHIFERVSGVRHEEMTRRVIEDPDSDVHRILREHDRELPNRLIAFLAGQPRRTFFNDIIASQLDADRFDYLLRDNLMTGSQYGGFDLGWLLMALTVDEKSNCLAVTHKGISAIEDYLQSRYHMYRNVYFHKVVRSAEGMLRLALQRARRLAVQDRLPWPPRDNYVYKALLGQNLTTGEFIELDDIAMLQCFKLWMVGEDQTLAQLCRGLLFRKLFKVIDLSSVKDPAKFTRIRQVVEETIGIGGGDPAYDLFFDEPADTSEDHLSMTGAFYCGDGIRVRDIHGRMRNIAEISPLVHALDRQLSFKRLHMVEQWKPAVLQMLESF